MTTRPSLFAPVSVGGRTLPNRVVMAPLTRSRAGERGRATALMADYYAQRASAGLIIAESTQVSADGQSAIATPGLHTDEQTRSWRQVTDAVHSAGGRIFVQLMHAGRVSHPDLLPDGLHPVAPSALAPAAKTFTSSGMVDCPTPRELTRDRIGEAVADFARAARNAMAAGFDGVEVHAANGYLINQFLCPDANRRTDEYGGPVAGRVRFAREVTDAVTAAVGPERVGIRISPWNTSFGIVPADDDVLYPALVEALPASLAYLHVREVSDRPLTARLRALWNGPLVLNPHPGGLDDGAVCAESASAALAEDTADLVSFGALFLANPDLPARLCTGGPFNAPDPSTFYAGGARGYTDYPTLAA